MKSKSKNLVHVIIICSCVWFTNAAYAEDAECQLNLSSLCFVTTSRIEVPMCITSSSDNGDLTGLSGEVLYDSNLLEVPTIENGEDDRVKMSGVVVEPGVYRFSLYTTPVDSFLGQPSVKAKLIFPVRGSFPMTTEMTFINMVGSDTLRKIIENIPSQTIAVRAQADEWILYP